MALQYINGKCLPGKGEPVEIFNPATEDIVDSVQTATREQAIEALEAAQAAFPIWSSLSLEERGDWICKLSDAILAEKGTIADLLSREVGLPYSATPGEVAGVSKNLLFMYEEAKRVYGTTLPDYGAPQGEVYHFVQPYPLGVTVGHLAWNHPLHFFGAKLAPALASGCTCVLKPSISTPLASLYIAAIAERIGFPRGVFNVLAGPSGVIGKALNESKIPRLIGVIGSSETGRQVMSQGATSIKRYSLELGGNAPLIIMPDASLDDAVSYIVQRKTDSCGQGCSNINRVYVHRDVHDKVVELLLEKLRRVKVGWGKDEADAMGPQINKERRNALLDLIDEAVKHGAKLLYGGKIPEGMHRGAFIMPTLLDETPDDAVLTHLEIFGPVIPVYTFTELDDAIARGNDTESGLAAYVYSHDSRVIAKCSEKLTFGMIYVNNPVFGGSNLPHIGVKESGIGCDYSRWSLENYYMLRRTSMRP